MISVGSPMAPLEAPLTVFPTPMLMDFKPEATAPVPIAMASSALASASLPMLTASLTTRSARTAVSCSLSENWIPALVPMATLLSPSREPPAESPIAMFDDPFTF